MREVEEILRGRPTGLFVTAPLDFRGFFDSRDKAFSLVTRFLFTRILSFLQSMRVFI